MALTLSIKRIGKTFNGEISLNKRASYTRSFVASLAVMYSASVVESDTQSCRRLAQITASALYLITIPLTDFRVFVSLA